MRTNDHTAAAIWVGFVIAGLVVPRWLVLGERQTTAAEAPTGEAVSASPDSIDETQAVDRLRHAGGRVSFNPEGAVLFAALPDDAADELLAILAAFPKLENLKIRRATWSDAGLNYLGRLTHLRFLDLQGAQLSDDDLAKLRGLECLEYLDLDGSLVTDAGVVHLRSLSKLQFLFLANTPFTEVGRELLHVTLPDVLVRTTPLDESRAANALETIGAHLRRDVAGRVSHVDLSDTPTTDVQLRYLHPLKSLHALDLRNTQITDAGLTHLTGLSGLTSLRIAGTKATRIGALDVWRAIPQVAIDVIPESAAVGQFGERFDASNRPIISGTSRLVYGGNFNRERAWRLADTKDLTSLVIIRVTDKGGFAVIRNLDSLRALTVRESVIPDDQWATLSMLGRLEELHLVATDLRDEHLEHIAKLTKLRTLDLTANEITDAGLARLSELVQLRQLSLTQTMITDDSIEHLAKLTGLRTLRLYDTAVGQESLERLQQTLPDCHIFSSHENHEH